MTAESTPATPAVRAAAAARGIDLASVKGTGVGGRITLGDVRAAVGEAPPVLPPSPADLAYAPWPAPGTVPVAATDELPPFTASGVDPQELLRLPALLRPAAAAAPDRGTVLAMIQSHEACEQTGVVSAGWGVDTSWINDVWPIGTT
jgi:pyruvate/2-oxoglutarate dehydrogenase complex dihydrolipoamide acyltransferase (E2) component